MLKGAGVAERARRERTAGSAVRWSVVNDRWLDLRGHMQVLEVEPQSFPEICLSLLDRLPLARHLDLAAASDVPPVVDPYGSGELHARRLVVAGVTL